jgi:hypothetical protein
VVGRPVTERPWLTGEDLAAVLAQVNGRWPGARSALTTARALGVLREHELTERAWARWWWKRRCIACLEWVPCRQVRWAEAELETLWD